MRIGIFTVLLIVFILFFSTAEAENLSSTTYLASMPVYFPEDIIGSKNPYFIWYDENNERDIKDNVSYRITLKPEKEQEIKPVLMMPNLFDKYYYYFKWPFPLEPDKYTYTIERLSNLQPTKLKYFRYLKYPVTGKFEIDPDEKIIKDDLPPDKLIEYLKLEKENKLINRNNFFFYSTASIGSFGIGLLFYKVLDFGLISKIIYYIAFTSSAVGAGAAGYYGVNYLYEKNNLQKIADIGKNISINGTFSSSNICLDLKMHF